MNILDIDRWKLFLALKDASDFIWDWGHRLNPLFHRPLAKATRMADPGFVLNFNDPAVQSLFRLIGFPPDPREQAISDLANLMNFWSTKKVKSDIHAFSNSAECAELLDAKNSSGWQHLDALLTVACGEGLTRFYDAVSTLFLSDETGGTDCYRIKVGPSPYSQYEWFAASSTIKGIVDLLRRVLEEGVLDEFFRTADSSVPKAHVCIYLNDALLLNIPVLGGEKAQPCWEKAEVAGKNLQLISYLAGLAPEETTYRWKGEILEDELGL